MKVLMYGWEFPPNISGGLGIACHGIIKGLLANGVEVTLVLPRFPMSVPLFPDIAGLRIIRTPFFNERINSYPEYRLYSGPSSTTMTPRINNQDLLAVVEQYAAAGGAFAKTIPYDVIHAHDWLTILAGIAAKSVTYKPLIFHIHSLEKERSAEPINQAIFDIEKYGLEQSDFIITVSEFTKRTIIRYYGISAEKIIVAHNGLFEEQIPKQLKDSVIPNYKTVLFLGRITYQKGPFYFIEAAYKILRHREDIQFVIAGDGDLFHSVIERVAELKLGTHIHFTHFLDRNLVRFLYKKSQVYVMPSVSEPFGLTCLEALAEQLPVILSKQSGVSEVIQSILKIDFWNTDELAEKINALIDYPALRRQIIGNSIPELQQLLWTKTAKKIFNVYQRLTGI